MSCYTVSASVVEDPILELSTWEWILGKEGLSFEDRLDLTRQINMLHGLRDPGYFGDLYLQARSQITYLEKRLRQSYVENARLRQELRAIGGTP